jgi:energy-coupling factor transporter ATP-binding protein EcfA2
MSVTPLKNEIIEWLKNQHYWFQYVGNQLVEGIAINDTLINETYSYFKEDLQLTKLEYERTPIVFNEIPIANIVAANSLHLLSIHSIQNVNALVQGQAIAVSKNLTLVYGNNGSGKSGYIRLLNNAFNSRGDKNMLSNVFTANTGGLPSCKFVYQSTGEPYEKEFPTNKGCYEFSQYSSFDTQSVKVHLDNDNQLNFTPTGFDFFEKVQQLFDALKEKLNAEIQLNKPQNSFTIHFQNENVIKSHITQLSANSNIAELEKLGVFTDADKIQLDEISNKIAALRALNIQQQIAGFEKLQKELQLFKQQQQAILDCLTKEKIDYYFGLIDTFHNLQTISNAEGIKSLEQFNISLVSSSQWREFIIAAKNYAIAIETNRDASKVYPAENDNCIFCLQPIAAKENLLINTYWQFLKSEAERELIKIKQKINEAIQSLNTLVAVKFDESLNLYNYLNSTSPALVIKWAAIVSNSAIVKQNLIQNLITLKKDFPVSAFLEKTDEFNGGTEKIKLDIDTLFAKKPDQEIATLTYQMLFLKDKSLLNQLLPTILSFIASHKWAASAEQALSAFKTNSITSLQGALFAKHITENYTNTFNAECLKLNAPKVVEIVQQNSKVKSFRKLLVAKQIVSQILSEGEQRAISLADFLTEVQLNPNNRGVIFDDPVTSLDHQRRAIIAKRLVDLSALKQVIIFTHDISFFSKLTSYADKNADLVVTKTTIRKSGDVVGIIKPDLPWVAQKVRDRIGFLRNTLVSIKKVEKEGDVELYNMQIKGWYGMLREAWERSVEERLFKGAIERFSGEIHTKPLAKVVVTPDLITMIDTGMSEASNWVHDQAMGLNPPIPDSNKAETDLKYFESFAEICKPS